MLCEGNESVIGQRETDKIRMLVLITADVSRVAKRVMSFPS